MFRANALYEGQYLLGTSIARPLIAKRLIEIAARDRRRRGRPRRHRQGQRPGALRAHLLRARARHQGDRAVARMGARPRAPSCSSSPRSTRSRSPRTSAARRRSRSTPTSCTPRARARSLEDPWEEADEMRLPAHHLARGRAGQGDLHRDRLREGRRRRGRRRGAVAGDAARPSSTSSARQQRHRPPRPGREPLRRHEEPRHLRDAGRHDPATPPTAASNRSRSTAARRISRTS